MDVQIADKKATSEFTIKPFIADSKEAQGQELPNIGEWLIEREGKTATLHFGVDSTWSEQKMAEQFRLLAQKTEKYWGAKPHLDLSKVDAYTLPIIRGLNMNGYTQAMLKPQKTKLKTTLSLVGKVDAKLLAEAKAEAEVQLWAMTLVDLPPERKTPEIIAAKTREMAKKYGLQCEVWNKDHIVKAGMNALYAVGRGSVNPPVLIILHYKGKPDSEQTDAVFVGKGITFDTGGISIKPSDNLHYMKSDMAGAAAALGAVQLAARLKLPINVSAVVPSAENSVGANALLPGEVIKSYSGKTIEIINTDAEGRLVLADAIAWVKKTIDPAVMIDLATLTGSAVRALGYEAAALYSDNEKLRNLLYDCGQETGEKLWPMPLWKDYDYYLHSDVADVANLPSIPLAGTIAAAKFLQVFTDKHSAWAHIDMPGVAFRDSPFFKTKSATGYGVQLLGCFIKKLAAKSHKF